MKITLLKTEARVPTRGSKEAAGLDLYAATSAIIDNGRRELIGLGFSMELPAGYAGLIEPRSSWACSGLTTDAGLIDSDYRGEVKVLLVNNSGRVQHIQAGDRIAQMLIEKVWMGEPEVTEYLTDTERGAGGFGSTGK